MQLKLKFIKNRWVKNLVFFGTLIGALSEVSMGASSSVDPNVALKNWLSANNANVLSTCYQTANVQAEHFLVLNPLTDNPTFLAFENTALLTCLYGLNLVNSAACLGAGASCQPVTLLVPSPADIAGASGASSSGAASSGSSGLNSEIYH